MEASKCPKCGDIPELLKDGTTESEFFMCTNCLIEGPGGANEIEAMLGWNEGKWRDSVKKENK